MNGSGRLIYGKDDNEMMGWARHVKGGGGEPWEADERLCAPRVGGEEGIWLVRGENENKRKMR